MVVWTLSIGFSVALLIVTAASRGLDVSYAYMHMAISAIMVTVITISALTSARREAEQGLGPIKISAGLAKHMGLVWAWGALALAATYATGIVSWKEWPGFLSAFTCLAGLSLFMANRLSDGENAETWFKVSRWMALGQMIGMIVVVLGLLQQGKMTRFLETQPLGWQDWAANNYFFFGAIGLAVISAYGLRAVPAETKTA